MHDRQDRRDLKAIPGREHERRQGALAGRAPLLLLRDDNGRGALAGCERRRARLIMSKLLCSGLHQLAPFRVVAPLVLHTRHDAANSYQSSRTVTLCSPEALVRAWRQLIGITKQ